MGEFPQLSITEIIQQIAKGMIRVPSFQRGFVWEPDDVAFFMDSLFKQFPVGSILLWRTKEKLKTEKRLGHYILPDPEDDYPVDYVLDGQQRLTSIFSVFQNQLQPQPDSNWIDIYYQIGSNKSLEKNSFLPLLPDQVDPKLHFPISILFDVQKYVAEITKYTPEEQLEINKLFESFHNIQLPVQLIRTDNKGIVAIVFERINRAGVPLDTFQLLNSWSWSSEFDLQEKLDELSADLSEFSFGGLADDNDLLLKCFTGYILEDPSPSSITNLTGEQIRDNYAHIVNGLKSAVDFMRNELNLYSLEYVPYPAMMVSLVKFFGTDRPNGVLYTDAQRKQLIRWFWRSCFSRRYSSGVINAHIADIASMKRLIKDENTNISGFKCEVTGDFFSNRFAMTSVNTKTYITLLASKGPKSFISGGKVDLAETMKRASSKEFHHVFPDRYLQRLGVDRSQIYQLANFCFLNNADNQKIKDRAPNDYKSLMPTGRIEEILEAAICPAEALSYDYRTFVATRTDMLVAYANELIR